MLVTTRPRASYCANRLPVVSSMTKALVYPRALISGGAVKIGMVGPARDLAQNIGPGDHVAATVVAEQVIHPAVR